PRGLRRAQRASTCRYAGYSQAAAKADRGAPPGSEAGRRERPVDSRILAVGRGQERLPLGERLLARRPARADLGPGVVAQERRWLAMDRRVLDQRQGGQGSAGILPAAARPAR